MATDPLRIERRPHRVALITLNRPAELNALSSEMADALAAAVTELEVDDDVGAIVVAGEGRAFCAGADITELNELHGADGFVGFVGRLVAAFGLLAACPKPSVAAVHGVALGGGLELALACDLRVADEEARLGLPEIKLGLLPAASGTARLPRLLPKAVAKHMLMTGEPLSAVDAHRLGLVNEVVAKGGALDAALAVAAKLTALAPLAVTAAKRLVDVGAAMPLDSAIALERETVSMLFGTEDGAEGIAAFLEKRSPTFRGR